MTMLRRGLFHPRHAVAAVLLASLFLVVQSVSVLRTTGLPFLDGLFGGAATPLVESAVPIRTFVPEVQWSAGDDLRTFTRLLVAAESLHGDGLSEVVLKDEEIAISGAIEDGYPYIVQALADSLDADWAQGSSGWRIVVPLGRGKNNRRETIATETVSEVLLRHPMRLRLSSGPERRGPGDSSGNIRVLPVTHSVYRADLDRITPQDLLDAAAGLDNLPLSLASAECGYRDWLLESCTLHFESQTL